MTKLLHIIASPRGALSQSTEIAEAHIEGLKAAEPRLEVDRLHLWQEDLPEFDGDRAAAKMTFFGVGTLEGATQSAWDGVVEITNRFLSADHYVVSAPMWNGGIPYRLKLYIDIITQPGLTFGFDPVAGYSGLLKNKTATLALTSGVYGPGVAPSFGADFQASYLTWWFNLIGVSDVRSVRHQPSMMGDNLESRFSGVIADARRLRSA